MKPGDLVHVTADNCYFGLGLVIKLDENVFYVMTSDGRCMHYFGYELEPVQPDPP